MADARFRGSRTRITYFTRSRLFSIVITALSTAVPVAGAWMLVSTGTTSEATQRAAPPVVTQGGIHYTTPTPTPSATPPPPKKTEKSEPTESSKPVRKPKPTEAKAKPRVVSSGSCLASYYWEGQLTASGESFDPDGLTAAHRTLPMNTKVRVTNKNNGRAVTVRINDRGPFVSGRCLDLSKAAMTRIGGIPAGVIPVRYEVLAKG